METLNFSAAIHTEIKEKVFIYKQLRILFQDFDISKFSSTLKEVVIIFQAINPKSPRKVLEYQIMRRKTKVLELYLILDYERIMQGTDPENLLHIKEVFLKGCETFLKKNKRNNLKNKRNNLKNVETTHALSLRYTIHR